MNHIRILLFISVLTLAIFSELTYRKQLHEYSIDYQQRNDTITFHQFYSVISFTGEKYLMIVYYAVLLVFLPLNKSMSFLLCVIISTFACNFLKSVYAENRPFLEADFNKIPCSSGYGNPSCHSFNSTSMIFAIWRILMDEIWSFFKKNELTQSAHKLFYYVFFILSLSLSAVYCCFIMLSRVALNAHTINQVLYGFILGSMVYVFVFHVIQLPYANDEDLIRCLESTKFQVTSISLLMISLAIGVFVWFIESPDPNEMKLLFAICKNSKSFIFHDDALIQELILGSVISLITALQFLRLSNRNCNNTEVKFGSDFSKFSPSNSKLQQPIFNFNSVNIPFKFRLIFLLKAVFVSALSYLPYLFSKLVPPNLLLSCLTYQLFPFSVFSFYVHYFYVRDHQKAKCSINL